MSELTHDDVYPRGRGPHRFRIYRVRHGEREVLATTQRASWVLPAIVRLIDEGDIEYGKDDSVGVLDTVTDPGKWIIHPYTLGRGRSG